MSHTGILQEMGASHFHLILDILDHYNDTKKTLRISENFQGGKREQARAEEEGLTTKKEEGERERGVKTETEKEMGEYEGFWRKEKKREDWLEKEKEDEEEKF